MPPAGGWTPTHTPTEGHGVSNHTDDFHTSGAESTRVLDSDAVRQAREAAALAEAEDGTGLRAQEKAERGRSLGKVSHTGSAAPVGPVVKHHTNDRFLGSLGLFLLRLVTAASMGVHGFQKLTDIPGTTDFFTKVGVPSPHWAAIGTGAAEMLAAVALVFGILTRLAGLGVAATAIAALVLVKWGASNPFKAGVPGFSGELELLLAGIGLVLFCLGAGRWSVDGQFRANRRKAKEAR